MKKMIAVFLSVAMIAAMVAGCSGSDSSSDTAADTSSAAEENVESETEGSGSGEDDTASAAAASSENSISDLVLYAIASEEADTLLLIHSETGKEGFASNFVDGWLTNNPDGSLDYLLADWYETDEDGIVWTFHLRDDANATWVDYQGNYKADVTVQDWVTSAEFILNFWKNTGANSEMLVDTIEGASEYYEYTKELSEEEAIALTSDDVFADMVKVEADPDANTVTYTCFQSCPYFYTLAAHKCLMPACEENIEEIGAGNYVAADYDQIWYCGPYIMTSFVRGNEKVLEKNTSYWNYDNVSLFDTVTTKMIDSIEVGYQLYENGEIDQIELNESIMYSIVNDESNEYYDYLVKKVNKEPTYFLMYNYAKNNEDGTPDTEWNLAAANEAFRLSITYGVDLVDYFTRVDPINPYSIAAYTFTHGKVAYTTDGTDYRDLVIEKLGVTVSDDANGRYDAELGEQYKQQAIEELTAEGVSFPIQMDYYVASGNQSQIDTANVLKAAFEECLGSDYISFNIKTYISSVNDEVYTPSLQSISTSAWGQDFGDPINSVGNFTFGGYFDNVRSHSEEIASEESYEEMQTFTDMTNEANATVDVDDRLNAFADAEAYLIEHGFVCPLYLDVGWQLTKINDYTKAQAGYGSQDSRYVNWETNADGYTAEEFAEFKALREAGEM